MLSSATASGAFNVPGLRVIVSGRPLVEDCRKTTGPSHRAPRAAGLDPCSPPRLFPLCFPTQDQRHIKAGVMNPAEGFNLPCFSWSQAPAGTPAEPAEPRRPTSQKNPTDAGWSGGRDVAFADLLSLRGDSVSLASEMNVSRTVRGRRMSFLSGQVLFSSSAVQVSLQKVFDLSYKALFFLSAQMFVVLLKITLIVGTTQTESDMF